MAGQPATRQRKQARLRQDEEKSEHLQQIIAGIGKPPRLRRAKTLGKPYVFEDKHKSWISSFLTEMPSPQLAAKMLGCSTRTLYVVRDQDHAFKMAWDEAMEFGLDQMVGQAMEEAAGFGVRHVMTPQGEITTLPKERNDKILLSILNLKHGTKYIHEHTGSVTDKDEPGTMVLKVTPTQLGKLSRQEQRDLTVLLSKLESKAPQTINGSAQQAAAISVTHQEGNE